MAHNNWTREELILAFDLYLQLPFGKLSSGTPEIKHLAKLIGRTSGAVSMRLNNFASVDPYHQQRGIVGLKGGYNQVKPIWDEFNHDQEELLFETEKIRAKFEGKSVEELNHIKEEELPPEGRVREQIVKVRIGQCKFRNMVLSAYDNKCCITEISNKELLVAGHIRPWSVDKENRLNASNGLSLNALHDRAFEYGYITITPDYEILISKSLKKQSDNKLIQENFLKFETRKINLPSRFLPSPIFLEYHNKERFKG